MGEYFQLSDKRLIARETFVTIQNIGISIQQRVNIFLNSSRGNAGTRTMAECVHFFRTSITCTDMDGNPAKRTEASEHVNRTPNVKAYLLERAS